MAFTWGYLLVISKEILKIISVSSIWVWKITYLKLHLHLPGANELRIIQHIPKFSPCLLLLLNFNRNRPILFIKNFQVLNSQWIGTKATFTLGKLKWHSMISQRKYDILGTRVWGPYCCDMSLCHVSRPIKFYVRLKSISHIKGINNWSQIESETLNMKCKSYSTFRNRGL